MIDTFKAIFNLARSTELFREVELLKCLLDTCLISELVKKAASCGARNAKDLECCGAQVCNPWD